MEVDARVSSLTDFGAFCSLKNPNDGEFHGVEGLVHISELSWQRISSPASVLKVSEAVRVKVIGVDKQKARINLSVKQLSEDPIKETLEDLLPLENAQSGADGSRAFSGTVIAGLQALCDALLEEPGVSGVAMGRRGHNDRVVSQDLEIWLTTQVVRNGYNVVARAGTDVQEIRVETTLSRDEMKGAITRALNKMP